MSTLDGRVPDQYDGEDELEPRPEGFSGTVVTGAKWKMLTVLVSEGSRVVVSLVLARLLTPTDYGVAGMALVATSFLVLFSDPALGTALVQKFRITQVDRSTIFWTSTAIGVIATVGAILLSGLIADFMGDDEVKPLFEVASLSLFLNSVAVTPQALMSRELAFRSLQIREISATVCGAIVALGVAFAGYGAWAIVANWLTFSAISTALVWLLARWRPTFEFSGQSLRGLGGFGLKVFGARILSWANGSFDNVLVGRYLGAASLGSYSLAYNVMYMPMARIGLPLQQVVSPVFARLQAERERLQRAWLRSKQVSCAILIPGFLVTLVVAPDLVRVVFGSKWDAAVVPLQWLCVAGVAHSLVALHFAILQACGEVNALLRLNIVVCIITVGAFVAGVPFGIVGVAAFYAVAKWILVPIDTWITVRAVSFDFWAALRAGTGPLPVGLAATAAGFAARYALDNAGAPALVVLLLVAALVLAVYVLLMWVFCRAVVDEIVQLIRDRRAGSRAAAALVDPKPSSSAA